MHSYIFLLAELTKHIINAYILLLAKLLRDRDIMSVTCIGIDYCFCYFDKYAYIKVFKHYRP
jgi:hypothetical protein